MEKLLVTSHNNLNIPFAEHFVTLYAEKHVRNAAAETYISTRVSIEDTHGKQVHCMRNSKFLVLCEKGMDQFHFTMLYSLS